MLRILEDKKAKSCSQHVSTHDIHYTSSSMFAKTQLVKFFGSKIRLRCFTNIPLSLQKESILLQQRIFFDELGRKLGIKKLDEWYSVGLDAAIQKGGPQFHHVVSYFDQSYLNAIVELYPEKYWLPWKFQRVFISSFIANKCRLPMDFGVI